MKIREVIRKDKNGVPKFRYHLNVTRNEASLLQDALYELAFANSSGDWDSASDVLVVNNMKKQLDKEGLYWL